MLSGVLSRPSGFSFWSSFEQGVVAALLEGRHEPASLVVGRTSGRR